MNDSGVVRILFLTAGTICVGLAALGLVLPLVPTTPFLLLALPCFARSSRRFHGWLVRSRLFGPTLREWEENRAISLRAKQTAIILILLSFGVSMMWVAQSFATRSVLFVTACAILLIVGSLRTTPRNDSGNR